MKFGTEILFFYVFEVCTNYMEYDCRMELQIYVFMIDGDTLKVEIRLKHRMNQMEYFVERA